MPKVHRFYVEATAGHLHLWGRSAGGCSGCFSTETDPIFLCPGMCGRSVPVADHVHAQGLLSGVLRGLQAF